MTRRIASWHAGRGCLAALRLAVALAAIACAPAAGAQEPQGAGYAVGSLPAMRAAVLREDPARGPSPRVPRGPLAADLTSTLPFAATCSQPYPNANRAIALDAGGIVYAVALCGAEVMLAVSEDGGGSWQPPVVVSEPTDVPTSITVAGGTLPGHAIVGWASDAFAAVRTTGDRGRTFSPVERLFDPPLTPSQGLNALAVGATYHVMVGAPTAAPGGARLRRSRDRGGAWDPSVSVEIPWVYGDVLHDPAVADESVVELVSDNPSVYRTTSSDAAASFPIFAPLDGACCVYYSDWSLGCGLLLASGSTTSSASDLLWRYDLVAGSPVEQRTSLRPAVYQTRSVAVDGAGDAFTAGQLAAGSGIELQRWRARAPALDEPIAVAPAGRNPHLATCGAGTVLVTYQDPAGLFQLSVFCLGATCCEPGACAAPPVVTLLRNGDVSALRPPVPPLAGILAAGDGSGMPGRTALDVTAPAERYPGFVPGPLAGEMTRGGLLVFFELEAADGVARVLRLGKAGADLDVQY